MDRRGLWALLLVLALLLPGAGRAAGGEPLALTAYDQMNRPVAKAHGFVMAGGLLVTVYPVLEGGSWVLAESPAGEVYIAPYAAAADKDKNVAVLRFFSPTDLIPFQAAAEAPAPGQAAAVPGEGGAAECVIREVYQKGGADRLRFTSAAVPDMGAPLVNGSGEVLGMVVGTAEGGGYEAIAIREILPLLKKAEDSREITIAAWFGRAEGEGLPFPIPDPDFLQSLQTAPGQAEEPFSLLAMWTEHGAVLRWEDVSEAYPYRVYRSVAGGKEQLIATVDPGETYYLDAEHCAVTRGCAYRLAVVTGWQAGMTLLSKTAAVTPGFGADNGLLPPGGLRAEPLSARISWNAADGADGYFVYRSDSLDGPFAQAAQTESASYQDAAAVYGQIYFYKVASYAYSRGISPQSDAVSMQSRLTLPDKAPEGMEEPDCVLAITGSSGYLYLYQGAPVAAPEVKNESAWRVVTGYSLVFSCEDGEGQVIPNSGTGDTWYIQHTDRPLAPGAAGYPPYAWLTGYENVKRVNMAVCSVTYLDGGTVTLPREDWHFWYWEME